MDLVENINKKTDKCDSKQDAKKFINFRRL